ncbi:ankyrin repeat and SOCS box protein 9 [Nothobranchius furzeri]|uniref:Ankyrin repeat and SOCS box containing 9 n=1 Tax=Nothobranchius furzeri TaxID=105023 RepID=A0A9D3BQ12_NOTFU|nr:ankyrin repeat and SOCS box protein 9 [Nothobranchius furzeri]KAF7215725.1 ankyrin repeat and SOCS box containing 9 [Nothobranchius furzeri]
MSAGSTHTDHACPAGAAFVSNTLMSDEESDWSPIHDVVFNGRILTLQKLITQGVCVNLSTLDRLSPLHTACMQGHTHCAKFLVENGANVNSSTVDGRTALTEACSKGHVACVLLLLQHGASPQGRDWSSSPIHWAAAKGHPECVKALVQHRADVDQHIDKLGSPLHLACTSQQLSTVRKLLQLGANVNRDVAGESPLHTAARLSSPELVSVLLDHGADRLLVNSEGKRPLDLTSPDSETWRLLKEAGGSQTK